MRRALEAAEARCHGRPARRFPFRRERGRDSRGEAKRHAVRRQPSLSLSQGERAKFRWCGAPEKGGGGEPAGGGATSTEGGRGARLGADPDPTPTPSQSQDEATAPGNGHVSMIRPWNWRSRRPRSLLTLVRSALKLPLTIEVPCTTIEPVMSLVRPTASFLRPMSTSLTR